MAKILFVPTNSREVTQFSLVKHELGREPDWDVLSIALNDKMELLLHQEGFSPKRITDYRTWNLLNIVKLEKPEILITDFCGPIPNALIHAAHHAGVPCLQIDDGVTSERSALEKVSLGQPLLRIMRGLLKHIRGLSYLLITLMATSNPFQFSRKVMREIRRYVFHPYTSYTEGLNIAVLSQFDKDAYVSMGVPPERVFITGQPRFDLIWQKKPKPKEQVLIGLGIPETKGVIVLATQPLVKMRIWERQREQLVQAAVSAVKEFPDKQLVIKLHPDESIETYRKILTNIGEDKAIICRDVNLYELLNACDLLMTVHSTVGLEAMLFAKPVIVVNFTGKPCVMSYAESGAAINVCKEEDLAPAIWKALYDPQIREELTQYRKKFINEHVYKLDGQASKRAAKLIIELIKKAKTTKGEAKNIKVKRANKAASNSGEETKSLSTIVREERQFFDRIASQYDNMVGLYLPIEEMGTSRRVNDLKNIISEYNKRVLFLEIGCGTGEELVPLTPLVESQCEVLTGIDVSREMVKVAKSKMPEGTRTQLVVASAFELPFKERAFDVISCVATLHHLPDLKSALKEMDRVCKEWGTIYIEERFSNKFLDVPNNFLRRLGVRSKQKGSPHELGEGFPLSRLLKESSGFFKIESVEFRDFVGTWMIGRTLRSKKLAKLCFITDKVLSKIPLLRRFCLHACLKLRKTSTLESQVKRE